MHLNAIRVYKRVVPEWARLMIRGGGPVQTPLARFVPRRRAQPPQQRVLTVIAVFGRQELTHAVLGDLEREGVDVVVVDNRGDYRSAGSETVVRPGDNLGWAGGTNLGIEAGLQEGSYDAFLALNNDTRLSDGFVRGLVACQLETGAGVVGPYYDCFWRHQRMAHAIAPRRYVPRRRHFVAPFVDGTAMLMPTATVEKIGMLDAENFGRFGYFAEIDYCARARDAGLIVAVTRLSYLHHERASTGRQVSENYEFEAYDDGLIGLEKRWGPEWRARSGLDEAWGPDPRRRRAHRIPARGARSA